MITFATVTISGSAQSGTFTFTKPSGAYSKTASVVMSGGGKAPQASLLADNDNGNGTMTGTVQISGAPGSTTILIDGIPTAIDYTATVTIWITDKP